MPSTIDKTRRYLGEALDKELTVYERYVPSADILAEYLQLTKEALLLVVADVFDEKIAELTSMDGGSADKLNTITALTNSRSVAAVASLSVVGQQS